MCDAEASMTLSRVIVGVVGGAHMLMIAGMIVVLTAQPTMAKPEFTAQTKKPFGFCHQKPTGGGALTPDGEKFKVNGFKL